MSRVTDFIPVYPEIGENFIDQITKKKEYYDLRQTSKQDIALEGNLLKHQKLVQRLLAGETPYSKMIFFHGMGTGKTCASVAVAEHYKNSTLKFSNVKREFGKTIVLLKSNNVIPVFKKEINQICTKAVYTAKLTDAEKRWQEKYHREKELTERTKQQRTTKAISEFYEIYSFAIFIKNLPDDDEVLIEEYSNRIIIIDEVHKISQKEKNGDEALTEAEYIKLWKFLHLPKGCIVMLMTGTPIWDSKQELSAVMNLILDENEQLPMRTSEFNKLFIPKGEKGEGEIKPDQVERLLKIFNGRISYIRSETSEVTKIERGSSKPWLQYLKVYPDVMSELQSDYLAKVYDSEKNKMSSSPSKNKKFGLFNLSKNASIMVLPKKDGSVSAEKEYYYNEIVKPTGHPEIPEWMKKKFSENGRPSINKLSIYSVKFAATIQDILDHPNEPTFVFNEKVNGPGGCIMFGLLLEMFGFNNVTKPSEVTRPRPSYVIFSGESTGKIIAKDAIEIMLNNAFNESKNKHGKFIRVIVGSKAISEVYTFKHIRKVHIITPHWNLSLSEQAIFRVLRYGTHSDLAENEKNVEIFRHISVNPGKKHIALDGFPEGKGKDAGVITIDIHIYSIAENKEFQSRQFYRLMKKAAIDCALNYPRNVVAQDNEKSRDCDFMSCNYKCYGMKPTSTTTSSGVWDYSLEEEDLDRSTYDILYSDSDVYEYVMLILDFFRKKFSSDIPGLMTILKIPDGAKNVFLAAIDRIIGNKIIIPNRYGFDSFLSADGDILYLDDSVGGIKGRGECLKSFYSETPLISSASSLSEYYEKVALAVDMAKMEKCALKIEGFKTQKGKKKFIEKLSYRTKVLLFEAVLKDKYLKRKLGIRRTESENTISKIIGTFGTAYESKDNKYLFHILYLKEYHGVAYAVASQDIKPFGRTRVFDIENLRWFTADPSKEEVLIQEIAFVTKLSKMQALEDSKYGFYGEISKADGKFRIVRKHVETGKTVGGKRRGAVCSDMRPAAILDIVRQLDYFPNSFPSALDSLDKSELISSLDNIKLQRKFVTGFVNDVLKDKNYSSVKDFTLDELKGIYTLVNYTTGELCEFVQEGCKERGVLIDS